MFNIKKNSVENISTVIAAVSHRDHIDKIVPLKREMSELLSHSQPELRKSRKQHSVKTISRMGSRKSSKSPLRTSQLSSRR